MSFLIFTSFFLSQYLLKAQAADIPPINTNFNIFNLKSVLIMIKFQTFLIQSELLNYKKIQNKKYRIEKLFP